MFTQRPGGRGLRRATASIVIASLWGVASPSAAFAPAPVDAHDISSLFVTRSGSQLLLDGQPYTFSGVNIYNANSDGWCAGTFTDAQYADELDEIGLGGEEHGVIRAWFFQTLATVKGTGARDWSRFDRTLQIAAQKGYKVIPTLTDQWGECGSNVTPTYSFKSEAWYTGGYAAPDPGMIEGDPEVGQPGYGPSWLSYRDWVAEIVDRYKNDPTILAWQLINEAEVNPGGAFGGCEPGDRPYEILRDWTIDISGLVRSLDPNHLISLGTIGGGQCGTQIYQYKDLHALPSIDLCEVHDYTPNQAIPGDQWNGMNVRIQQCAELDKPMFVGEVGMWPEHAGGSFAFRAAAVRSKLLAQRALGVDGHLAWAWIGTDSTLQNYDIGPGDPVMDELREAGSSFVVTATDDAVDGLCDATHCSLREAITASNALPGYDVIGFAIPGPEPHVISPTSTLPAVTDGALIDATTQPDFRGYPVVELRGDDAPFGHGLEIHASHSAVRGFVIHGFGNSSIRVAGGSGSFITGNRVGTSFAGTAGAPRFTGVANAGIRVDGGSGHRIGGVAGGDGNTVSGNANGIEINGPSSGTIVLRNFIGTNVFGSGAVPNWNVGLRISQSSGNQVGAPFHGNVISGNYFGADILGPSGGTNVVQGNYVGLAIDGETALGNTIGGIEVNQSPNNLIGGSGPGEGNVISANGEAGIRVHLTSGTVVVGNRLGLNASGTVLRPNGRYAIFNLNAWSNRYGGPDPGDGNTIRGGLFDGIAILGDDSVGNVISGNSIHGTGRLGIALGNDGPDPLPITIPSSGPNHKMNQPVIDVADVATNTIEGRFYGLAGTIRLEFFASSSCDPTGYGEGERYLGTTDVNATGTPPSAPFSLSPATPLADRDIVTATATGQFGTSEFSACVAVTPPGEPTPVGTDVEVHLTAGLGVGLTFSTVTTAGVTSADASASLPAVPVGFQLGDPPLYYDISTTAVFSGPIEICLTYDEGSFTDEASARLLHHDGTVWQDVTTSVDPTLNVICGVTTSLSPFALVERAYIFEGFLAPVDDLPTINRVKAGTAIPVKFSLAGGNLGLEIFATGWPRSLATSCGSSDYDAVEQTVSAGSSYLAFDPMTETYTYVWKSDKAWRGCRALALTFRDGSTAVAWFDFRK